MFNGYGLLSLDNDHLDISYNDLDRWATMSPDGDVKGFAFEIGHPEVGPFVQLAALQPGTDRLDWEHSLDPPHYHGSDQFRIVSGGEWTLAGKPQAGGGFSFQEAGKVYREHPGSNGAAVMIFVADRRGSKPTIVREADRSTLVQLEIDHYIPVREGELYPHPAGERGTAAIATSLGQCAHGYLRGRFEELDGGIACGFLGDEQNGPAVYLFNGAADETLVPPSRHDCELMLSITGGSCRIGDREYRTGDMRIQKSGIPMDAIVSGPEGVTGALIVMDRNASTAVETDETPWLWAREAEQVRMTLAPKPGSR